MKTRGLTCAAALGRARPAATTLVSPARQAGRRRAPTMPSSAPFLEPWFARDAPATSWSPRSGKEVCPAEVSSHYLPHHAVFGRPGGSAPGLDRREAEVAGGRPAGAAPAPPRGHSARTRHRRPQGPCLAGQHTQGDPGRSRAWTRRAIAKLIDSGGPSPPRAEAAGARGRLPRAARRIAFRSRNRDAGGRHHSGGRLTWGSVKASPEGTAAAAWSSAEPGRPRAWARPRGNRRRGLS